jgi:uncharacterized protein
MSETVQETPAAAGDERLPVLDLIRGVAILGILPANIPHYSGALEWLDTRWSDGSASDLAVVSLTLLLIDIKFITLLAMLFGAGMELQRARAAEKRRSGVFFAYYVWRQALLFLIGLMHGVLLWYGDILVPYAILGVVALVFALLIPGRALFWVVVLLEAIFFCFLLLWAGAASAGLGGAPPPREEPIRLERPYRFPEVFEPVQRGLTPEQVGKEYERRFTLYFSAANQERIYGGGSYADMVAHRAFLTPFLYAGELVFIGPHLLACFLLGAWFVRTGLFHRPQDHRTLLWRLVGVGLAVAVPIHLGALGFYLARASAGGPSPESVGEQVLNLAGALPQSLAYLGLLILWQQSGSLPWLQYCLRAVGRMALTCYLTETVLCTTLFYSYGLGMFGRLSRTQDMLVVVGVWLILLVAAPLWLRVFRMGPVEWVWRCLAEFRLRPLLRSNAEAA